MKSDNLIHIRSVMERMTTDQLDELLHDELGKDAPNGEVIRQALKVLEDREKEIPVEMTPDIVAAWERYQENADEPADRPARQRGWILKVASVVVVLVVALAALSQPAEAKGFFDRLISWTDSFFQLLSPGDDHHEEYVFMTDNPGLQEVYDAVVELGITDPVVPMWLPEGYELVECKVTDSFSGKGLLAVLSEANSTFILKVNLYSNIVTNKYQKDDTQVKTIERGGVVHNIMENNGVWTVVWTRENVECFVYIDCQEEILYKVLGSIYTMEDD